MQGSSVAATVSVKNNGTRRAVIKVHLSEKPGNWTTSKSVTLNAGATSNVAFTWATTASTAVGTHTFTASVQLSNDGNSSNNSSTATTTVQAAQSVAKVLSVKSMTGSVVRSGSQYRLTYTVTVQSGSTLASNARVTLQLLQPNGQTASYSATTNSRGVATITRNVTQRGAYVGTVGSISRSGYTYDAARNVVSSVTLRVP